MRRLPLIILGFALTASAQEGTPVPEVSPPPLLNDAVPLPEVDPNVPGAHSAFVEAVDRQLLSFRQDGLGLRLANREKSRGFGSLFWDDELEAMFIAVPAATALFQEARGKTFTASLLTIGGFVGVAASLALVVAFILSPTLPLLIAAVALDLVALVVTLIAVPFRYRAQAALYEAVEVHNRGLLRLPFSVPSTDPSAPEPSAMLLRF